MRRGAGRACAPRVRVRQTDIMRESRDENGSKKYGNFIIFVFIFFNRKLGYENEIEYYRIQIRSEYEMEQIR